MDQEKAEGPYATPEAIAQFIKDHLSDRDHIVEIDEEMHFSYDLEKTLTEEEREAGQKLQEMTRAINDPEAGDKTIMNFFK